MLTITLIANLFSQSKYSSHLKFLFSEHQCKTNVAASFAVIFVGFFSNFVSAKSKIAKHTQVKSANEDDGNINPPLDNLLKIRCAKD